MKTRPNSYNGYHRYPAEIISHTVWLYHRFTLSFRDIEDLLAERAITVTYETIRQWCLKFGLDYAKKLKKRQGRLGDTWYMDEVIIKINEKCHYLWRAIDQDGDVVDILVQSRRDKRAALRFLRKLLKGQGQSPRTIVTDKLRSYGAARSDAVGDPLPRPLCQIGQKPHTAIPGNRNGKCVASNRPDRHSDFSPCSAKFIICFASVVTF